ncbi:LysM peptidoglycan-binding domain-containing protein, partial [Alcanivorax sp.]|uniref:LysM peptidoglycan-binding domain-containing protein n=1 Tax=Alcanivorax sp. TaxID=1872427 RepID=UPI00258A5F67
VTKSALKQANRLRDDRLKTGMVLIVPPSNIGSNTKTTVARRKLRYQVREGDSLYRIAHRFGVRIPDLKRWNRLVTNRIRPGQTLTVIREL